MLFSRKVWALLALMSSTVAAAGSDVHFECPAAVAGDPALLRCQATARHLKRLELKRCNLIACISANAGVVVSCATAVAMDILDRIADSICLAAISGAFKECEDCI